MRRKSNFSLGNAQLSRKNAYLCIEVVGRFRSLIPQCYEIQSFSNNDGSARFRSFVLLDPPAKGY